MQAKISYTKMKSIKLKKNPVWMERWLSREHWLVLQIPSTQVAAIDNLELHLQGT